MMDVCIRWKKIISFFLCSMHLVETVCYVHVKNFLLDTWTLSIPFGCQARASMACMQSQGSISHRLIKQVLPSVPTIRRPWFCAGLAETGLVLKSHWLETGKHAVQKLGIFMNWFPGSAWQGSSIFYYAVVCGVSCQQTRIEISFLVASAREGEGKGWGNS
jgi:hypothetical protein